MNISQRIFEGQVKNFNEKLYYPVALLRRKVDQNP
jgi:hypothetical protein